MKIYADKTSFQSANMSPLLRNLMELWCHPNTPRICVSITTLAGACVGEYYKYHGRLDAETQKTIRMQLMLDYLKSAAATVQASSGGGVEAQARTSSTQASPDTPGASRKVCHPHGSDKEQSLRTA